MNTENKHDILYRETMRIFFNMFPWSHRCKSLVSNQAEVNR